MLVIRKLFKPQDGKKGKKDIMKNINKIPLFALLFGISWIISFGLIIMTYNFRKTRPCQLEFEPNRNRTVMKEENDTTEYMSMNNGDCFCNKVHCLRRCCLENEEIIYNETVGNLTCQQGVTDSVFSSHFPYYITENVTVENMCPRKSDIYNPPINFTLVNGGSLHITGEDNFIDYNKYCLFGNTEIFVCERLIEQNDSIQVGK